MVKKQEEVVKKQDEEMKKEEEKKQEEEMKHEEQMKKEQEEEEKQGEVKKKEEEEKQEEEKIKEQEEEEEEEKDWRLEMLSTKRRMACLRVLRTGMGVCTKCHWRSGCHMCEFEKAVRYYMRNEGWIKKTWRGIMRTHQLLLY